MNILVPFAPGSDRARLFRLAFSGPEDSVRALARFLSAWARSDPGPMAEGLAGTLARVGRDGVPVPEGSIDSRECSVSTWLDRTLRRTTKDWASSKGPSGPDPEDGPDGGWIWHAGLWKAPTVLVDFKSPARIQLRGAAEILLGWETDPICLETSGGPSLRREDWTRLVDALPDEALLPFLEAGGSLVAPWLSKAAVAARIEAAAILEATLDAQAAPSEDPRRL